MAGGLLFAATASVPAGATTTILANFSGIDFSHSVCGCLPPDSNGAVGPTQVAELVNGGFAAYDKTGTLLLSESDSAFFGTPVFSDPRIVYDAASGRWFATEMTTNASGGTPVLLTYSKDSNLLDGFNVPLLINPPKPSDVFDMPTLGVDAKGVYVTAADFSGATVSQTVYSIPKADILGGVGLANMTSFAGLDTNTYGGFIIQPVSSSGAFTGTGGLLAKSFGTFGTFIHTVIENPDTASATLAAPVFISGATDGDTVPAQQPGAPDSIETNSHFRSLSGNVVQVGNLIFEADTISDGIRNQVHWSVIDGATNTIKFQGVIKNPSFDYFFGSIAASADGTFVIGFNRSGSSGPDGFVGSYAEACKISGASVACDKPKELFGGLSTDPFGFRWGDYSTTVVDPTNPDIFWTMQEVSPLNSGNNVWATQITEIEVNGVSVTVPEPLTSSVILAGLVGVGVFRRGQRRPRSG